jgi:hypothetical protein
MSVSRLEDVVELGALSSECRFLLVFVPLESRRERSKCGIGVRVVHQRAEVRLDQC